MSVCLIMCGKHKKPFLHRAKNLYTSERFRDSLERVYRICGSLYILSAKHRLLKLDEFVLSYDMDLSKQSKSYQMKWADEVYSELVKKYKNNTIVHFFAEPLYYERVQKLLNNYGYRTFIH